MFVECERLLNGKKVWINVDSIAYVEYLECGYLRVKLNNKKKMSVYSPQLYRIVFE